MLTLAIDGDVTVMPAGWSCAIGATLALSVGLFVLATGRSSVRQTTLLAPWWWAIAAFVAWSGVELMVALAPRFGGGIGSPLRLAAITLSFCPVIALLGAKRPQDRAWQFVVLSLWAIVALPAAETYFLRPGQAVRVGDARAWFLWIPILLGPINFVPTRYWIASLLFAAGQIIALSHQLALLSRPLLPHAELVGLLLVAAALVAAWFAARRSAVVANEFDRLWSDFRNSFGLLWALRVQERINATAAQNQWDLELTWNDFRPANNPDPQAMIDAESLPKLRPTFVGLLRRFVSNSWIEERMGTRDP